MMARRDCDPWAGGEFCRSLLDVNNKSESVDKLLEQTAPPSHCIMRGFHLPYPQLS
jgi:hypothetical protein